MEQYICWFILAALWLMLLGGIILSKWYSKKAPKDQFTVTPDSLGLPDWEYRFGLCKTFRNRLRVQCIAWPCSFGSTQSGLTRWHGRVVLNRVFESQQEAETYAAQWAEANQHRLAEGGIVIHE